MFKVVRAAMSALDGEIQSPDLLLVLWKDPTYQLPFST
jgi:hypothetical protein